MCPSSRKIGVDVLQKHLSGLIFLKNAKNMLLFGWKHTHCQPHVNGTLFRFKKFYASLCCSLQSHPALWRTRWKKTVGTASLYIVLEPTSSMNWTRWQFKSWKATLNAFSLDPLSQIARRHARTTHLEHWTVTLACLDYTSSHSLPFHKKTIHESKAESRSIVLTTFWCKTENFTSIFYIFGLILSRISLWTDANLHDISDYSYLSVDLS